jgi:hypothetical protein
MKDEIILTYDSLLLSFLAACGVIPLSKFWSRMADYQDGLSRSVCRILPVGADKSYHEKSFSIFDEVFRTISLHIGDHVTWH